MTFDVEIDNGQSIGSAVSDELSVAGSGRLQLTAGNRATSVALLQVVEN